MKPKLCDCEEPCHKHRKDIKCCNCNVECDWIEEKKLWLCEGCNQYWTTDYHDANETIIEKKSMEIKIPEIGSKEMEDCKKRMIKPIDKDYAYCIVCGTDSREPEKGAGHYCHKCKEYDYA